MAMELDPVCGMTVEPARAKSHVEHANKTYSFCCEGCAKKFSAEPAKYLNSKQTPSMATAASPEAISVAHPKASLETTKTSTNYICPMDPEVREQNPGACPKCGMALEPSVPSTFRRSCRIYLPDASGNHSLRARRMPDLWNGSRTAHRQRVRRSKSRTLRHVAPLLDQCRAYNSCSRPRHVRHAARPASAEIPFNARNRLDRTASRNSHCPVGRLSLFSARLGLNRKSKPQYVHPHRARHRHSLHLQRRRSDLPQYLPALISNHVRRHSRLFRSSSRDHNSRSSWSSARTSRKKSHVVRYPRTFEPDPKIRAPGSHRWHRDRRPRRAPAAGRHSSCTPRRTSTGRWSGARRLEFGG